MALYSKNYYVPFRKKSAWKNTTHLTVFNNKIQSIESSYKFYETNLQSGKWKEITLKNRKNDKGGSGLLSKSSFNVKNNLNKNFSDQYEHIQEDDENVFKNVVMLISNSKSILISNNNGYLIIFDPNTREANIQVSNTIYPQELLQYLHKNNETSLVHTN